MRGMYILLGNLLMAVAVVIALVSGGGEFIGALLEGTKIELYWRDFLFPAALFLTGFTLQFCALARGIFLLLVEELLLIGSLTVYIRESLDGGLTWWFAPLRDYIQSNTLFTALGLLLPVVLIILMAALIVKMASVGGEKRNRTNQNK